MNTKLHSNIDDTYKASWLELFFDLVFVALVAQLTYHFSHHHHTLEDFLQVGLVGYMIFLAWMITTANRNLKQGEDVIDTLSIQLQMVMIMVMSLTLPEAFGEYSWLFFGAMSANMFIGLYLITRFYKAHPDKRPQTYNTWWGFFIAACLWLLTGFVPIPYLYVVAGCALLMNILSPMTHGKGNGNRVVLLNMHHLLERLGLFLLMVMGEAVLVVALANTAAKVFDLDRLVLVLSGLVLMITFWWLYFPYMTHRVKGRRAKPFQLMLQTYGFLYGSLILIATGLKILLETPASSLSSMWIFISGVVLLVLTFNIIRSTLTHKPQAAVTSVVEFLILLSGAIGACLYFQWTALVMVPAVTFIFIVYTVLDYRQHCLIR